MMDLKIVADGVVKGLDIETRPVGGRVITRAEVDVAGLTFVSRQTGGSTATGATFRDTYNTKDGRTIVCDSGAGDETLYVILAPLMESKG